MNPRHPMENGGSQVNSMPRKHLGQALAFSVVNISTVYAIHPSIQQHICLFSPITV